MHTQQSKLQSQAHEICREASACEDNAGTHIIVITVDDDGTGTLAARLSSTLETERTLEALNLITFQHGRGQ